ncbi:MAG: DUF1993 domain-containing protein [Hyphomonadaceae bacterium]|nr:DUF1993 domain-containing protein [Hyphomonadaceae bacterium]
MALSLYDITAPSFRQTLEAVSGLLDKAQAHCGARSIPEADFIEARLAEDMFPFSYQVKSTVVHSIGALQSLSRGVFSPDLTPPPNSFAALKEQVTGARMALDALSPAEVDAYEGRDMAFQFKEFKLPFTAENFLMSFSLPNFYFHAATAYDIMRHKGVAIGKRDFMGPMRIKV